MNLMALRPSFLFLLHYVNEPNGAYYKLEFYMVYHCHNQDSDYYLDVSSIQIFLATEDANTLECRGYVQGWRWIWEVQTEV